MSEFAYVALGEKIRRGREEAGLTQEALAAKAGVNVKTVRRWELGEGISDESIRKIAPLIDRSGDKLLNFKRLLAAARDHKQSAEKYAQAEERLHALIAQGVACSNPSSPHKGPRAKVLAELLAAVDDETRAAIMARAAQLRRDRKKP